MPKAKRAKGEKGKHAVEEEFEKHEAEDEVYEDYEGEDDEHEENEDDEETLYNPEAVIDVVDGENDESFGGHDSTTTITTTTTTKAPRRQNRLSLPLEPKLSSFEAISIGKKGPLASLSSQDDEMCIREFDRRLQFTVHTRYQHSLLDETAGIMTSYMSAWWRSKTEEEVFNLVWLSIGRDRRVVLGGM
jgi:hypothetical protein